MIELRKGQRAAVSKGAMRMKTAISGALVGATVLYLGGCACGDDGQGRDHGDGLTGAEDGGTDTGSVPDTATGTGTEGEECPPERLCANGICCDVGQICHAGECKVDCGGEPGCGESQECCEDGDLCYLGACVTPGDDCGAGACATNPSAGDCEEDEICDPTIGKCLPTQASDECIYVPPEGVFDPVPLFTWGVRVSRPCATDADCQKEETCGPGGTCEVTWSHVTPGANDLPDYYQVTSIPMVADLDADCVPEIVFNSYQGSTYTSDGVLRAIRGDDGSRVWTVTEPTYRTDATANPALGDINGDGLPEIVVQGDGKYLIAIASTGVPMWMSDDFAGAENSGSAAIANIDGDGAPEIVFGAAVYDHTGSLVWEGTDGIGHQGQGPISCVADLDGDGRAELIGGKTAYRFTGTVAAGTFVGAQMWDSTEGDGYCGIADFDDDQSPEVVLVEEGNIHVLDGIGGATMASIAIPGGGKGGAPNIADFDGDGRPDIGTAGGSNYVVVTFDGVSTLQILWQAATEDDSSSRTGSSVFDFDGDGHSEVVYNDEEYLRIYPGLEPDCTILPVGPGCDGLMTDAEIVFRDLNSSRTRTEYPVIADVDGDFKAEIVFATNNEAGFLDPELVADAGIEVWADRLDNWMPTRPVWNQHTYHITNVGVSGAIPIDEEPNWASPAARPFNSYRRNTQGEIDFCAPDLVPKELQADFMACPDLELSVWVVNQGCLGVGPGVNVAFYEQTFGLLGVVQTQGALVGGAAEKVSLSIPALIDSGTYEIWAVVDDDGAGDGALNECDEDNNAHPPVEICNMVG